MHDPLTVAFEIRRPWPKHYTWKTEQAARTGTRWKIGAAFWVIAGRGLYFPSLITVWHRDPSGYDDTTCRGKWWRLHVHHWKIQLHPLQELQRRLLTRCAWCGDGDEPAPGPDTADACRPVEVDGETIRVRGSGEFTEQEQGFFAEIVRAAKRRHAAEHPETTPLPATPAAPAASTPDARLREEYAEAIDATRHPDGTPDAAPTVGDWEQQRQRAEVAETRLRLAHQARRAKDHQLDDIRRALCDAELMQDTDPYSHADLADVIRQAAPTAAAGAAIARVRALADDMRNWCSYRGMALHYSDTIRTALDDTTPAEQANRPDPAECKHEAALARVRALHYEVDGTPHATGSCIQCGSDYPCPTLRAVDQPADTTQEH